MIKKISFLLFFVLIFSACAKNENENKEIKTGNRPDFGQPERPVDINGFVKNIVGNEVTILKIERGANFAERENGDEDTKKGSAENNLSLNAPSGNIPGGGIGGGGGMGRFPGAGQSSATDMDRQAILERMKQMSTGEEKIIIPVGIQMLKADTQKQGEDRLQMIEANFSDIKTDTMLRVWLDENVEDRKVASFVVINNF